MSRSTRFAVAVLAVVCLLRPLPTAAQAVGTATIAGIVTDASGGVLPGVTVEATSPALIEGTRAVTTNEAGRFSIVNLRPGTYTVTFSLASFSTVKREGVELTSDFTANLPAQLSPGPVAETITVQGQAAVVDVQSVAQPKIYTRDMLDALPTDRTPNGALSTIPGAQIGNFGLNSFRGTQDSLTMVDGMRMTYLVGAGPGSTTAPTSSNMYQEFSFSTNIDSAEAGQPGMRINLVPRDGGNEFHGAVFGKYTTQSWQSDNIDDTLRSQNVQSSSTTQKQWDINPSVGGPIKRDKLWYYFTYQNVGQNALQTGSFYDSDPLPYRYVADPSRPGGTQDRSNSIAPRVTWQASSRDKIAGYYERFSSDSPFFYNAQIRLLTTSTSAPLPPEATQNTTTRANSGGARWTRTQTSRLLFETAFSGAVRNNYNDYPDAAAAWSARNLVDPGLPAVGPATYSIGEISTNQLLGFANNSAANLSKSFEIRTSATYATGSHSIKAGGSFFRGTYARPVTVIGDVVLRLSNGAASQAVLTLPVNRHDSLDGDWGVFVQDRWTVKRLTANLGLRMDQLQTSVPDQVLPASIWLAEQHFAGRDVLNWKDLSPRLGAAYDLFGNGKTALKVAVARFVDGETVNLTGQVNPMTAISTTDARAWTDLNRDFTIYNANGTLQSNELGPTTNANFGTPVISTQFDNDALSGWFKRGYSWETDVSVQHELLPSVGVTAVYYRRSAGNVRVTDNQTLTPASYDGPFCVSAPNDPRLPNAGQQVCGLYDVKPALRAASGANNFVTLAKNIGVNRQDVFTGAEAGVNARLPRGAFVSGGVSFANEHLVACDVIDNPELSRFCDTNTGYRPDIKINASYALPLGVRLSGAYRGLAGPQIVATWAAPNSVIQPALGRALSTGATTTKSIALLAPGTDFVPMRHIFDLRFSKLLRVSSYRLQLSADVYNAFNSNGVSTINTSFGTSWRYATAVQSPRQFQISTQFDF